ncbi:ABC transporter permease [Natronoglomus mannanivorans]|uniref:ABC transporter permease n=1 Tax=Natronoglomus mannanivorans TaxID=2979990 RepID=A0AAP2Z3A9_9EURY|nr:ABC transporter permease [Halobacteria archaeon AArc-xg1-1]
MVDTDTEDDKQTVTDGAGGAQAFFEQAGDYESSTTSKKDRTYRKLDLYIFAPFRVAWSDWRARVGISIIVFFVLLGTVGVELVEEPLLNEATPYTTWFQTWGVPLGTDNWGRPIHKMLVHSTPAILKMALAGVLFAVGLAIVIGIVAGYKGGTVDYVLMTLTDIVMIIPGLPLTIVLIAIWQPRDPFFVGVVLAIDSWPSLARMLRSQVLTIREEEYVEAARAMGVPTHSIVQKDITPQLMPYIMINASNAAQSVIFAAVGLYFLGFLPAGGAYNWGVMMNEAYQTGGALANPWRGGHWLFAPMIMLTVFTMGLILFSQGMDRVFNTKIRARHAKTVADDEEELN